MTKHQGIYILRFCSKDAYPLGPEKMTKLLVPYITSITLGQVVEVNYIKSEINNYRLL